LARASAGALLVSLGVLTSCLFPGYETAPGVCRVDDATAACAPVLDGGWIPGAAIIDAGESCPDLMEPYDAGPLYDNMDPTHCGACSPCDVADTKCAITTGGLVRQCDAGVNMGCGTGMVADEGCHTLLSANTCDAVNFAAKADPDKCQPGSAKPVNAAKVLCVTSAAAGCSEGDVCAANAGRCYYLAEGDLDAGCPNAYAPVPLFTATRQCTCACKTQCGGYLVKAGGSKNCANLDPCAPTNAATADLDASNGMGCVNNSEHDPELEFALCPDLTCVSTVDASAGTFTKVAVACCPTGG
jgi:hypothetical protein